MSSKICRKCGKELKPDDKIVQVYIKSSDNLIHEDCWNNKIHKKYILYSQSSWNFEDLMRNTVSQIVEAKKDANKYNKGYFESKCEEILELFLRELPDGIIATDGYYQGFLQRKGKVVLPKSIDL